MSVLKQSTSVVISFGPFLDKTDGVTLETGLVSALDHASTGIMLAKNGGTLTVRSATVTASTYDAHGCYKVTLSTTDTNTTGLMRVIYTDAATCLPVWRDFEIKAANVYDSLHGAGTVKLLTDLDTIKTNPVVNAGTVTFPTTATLASTTNITAGTIATVTNQLTAAQIATGVWTDTTTGDFTTAASIGKSVMNGVALGTGLTIVSVSGPVGSVTAGVTVTTNNDKTGYALSAVGVDAIWDEPSAGHVTAGTYGATLILVGVSHTYTNDTTADTENVTIT